MTTLIDRKNAEALILKTYCQFYTPLIQLYRLSQGEKSQDSIKIKEIYRNYIKTTGAGLGNTNPVGKINENIEPELKVLNDIEIRKILLECRVLAESYDLPVKREIPTDPVIDERKSKWVDNGNGTFTALEGATLWDLYGSTWRVQSGYTENPVQLRPGTVVGRNNDIIAEFKNEWGNQIKLSFGEDVYNTVGEFVEEKLAFPAKQISMAEVKDLFEEIGIELEEANSNVDEPEAALAEMPQYLLEGWRVHIAIGNKYRDDHKSEETRANFHPISSILDVFKDIHNVEVNKSKVTAEDLRKKPDITNIENYHLYEIKPKRGNGPEDAKKQRDNYLRILNAALAPGRTVVSGPKDDPSVKNGYVNVLNCKYKYESKEDGVILYEKVEEPKPEPVPNPSPIFITNDNKVRRSIEVPEPGLAWSSGFASLAVALLAHMALRLMYGCYVFILPILPTKKGHDEPEA